MSRDAVQKALMALYDASAPSCVRTANAGMRTAPPLTNDQATLAAELARHGLRTAVMDFVREEHDAGKPSEQVLVQLNGMAMDAHYDSIGSVDRRGLREEIFRWAIGAYYQS